MPADRGHRARKRFGQNFLVDQNILSAMARAVAPRPTQQLFEIGPGQGALTAHLIDELGDASRLTVVEIDRDLAAMLRERWPELTLIEADVLRIDLAALLATAPDAGWRLVGNLPYNISTPLLVRLFQHVGQIQDMHFLLQQEVVSRLAAEPGTKQWGRLSVVAQYHCKVQPLLAVPPQCFRPVPAVDSRFVRLTPRRDQRLSDDALVSFDTLVRTAFQQRRKTLRNALRTLALDWDQMPVSPELRPDQVDLDGYVALAGAYCRSQDRA